MKKNQEFTLTIAATKNMYLLNRMLNILTRNRIDVRQVHTKVNEHDGCYHINSFVLHTNYETAEKISKQMRRLVEVAEVNLQTIDFK